MKIETIKEEPGNLLFYCPGCECSHKVNTLNKNQHGSIWSFNGDFNNPTFTPSIHVWIKDPEGVKKTICHSYVTNGKIQYLDDCQHDLKGQTVNMIEIE